MKKLKTFAKTNKKSFLAASVAVAAGTGTALAGSTGGATGTQLDNVYTDLIGLVEGPVGKVIAISMLGASLYMGVVNSNLMGALAALAGGLILANAGNIIDTAFSAVI